MFAYLLHRHNSYDDDLLTLLFVLDQDAFICAQITPLVPIVRSVMLYPLYRRAVFLQELLFLERLTNHPIAKFIEGEPS